MFDIFEDDRGKLMPIEFYNLNFKPQRIFTVFDVPKNEIRGNHAHYNTIQLIVCIKGEILIGLDNGNNIEDVIKLNSGQSILIDKLIWSWQKFLTGEDIMIVLSSTKYDKSDFINDKYEYYKLKKALINKEEPIETHDYTWSELPNH